jgi:hypothetical protein
VKWLVTIAVLGILLLGAGAIAVVYLGGEGEPPPLPRDVEDATPAPAIAPVQTAPEVPAPSAPVEPARPSGPAPLPAPGAHVTAPPPPMPTDPRERADRQLEMRKERRNDALEQMNAREAARRKRLGLPAGPPPQPPPPHE